jgi:hypothetical protein
LIISYVGYDARADIDDIQRIEINGRTLLLGAQLAF